MELIYFLIIGGGSSLFLGGVLLGRYYAKLSQTDIFNDVVDFHEKFDLIYDGPPRALPLELFNFRHKFMQEELDEYADEQIKLVTNPGKSIYHLHMQLDALIDEIYVVLGTFHLQFGLRHGARLFWSAWRRVHAANMAKIRCLRPGDSKRGSTYDVIKPDGWTAPDHTRDIMTALEHSA
jgi:predicted HAD superfamily Cof-like phosphohydrolase